MTKATCDIIIPILNRLDLTANCLKSICDNTITPSNMILIDNGSDQETRKFLEDFSAKASSGISVSHSIENITLVRNDDNLGWVKAVNQGLRLSKNPYVCIMNNDTIVKTKGWLNKLIEVSNLEPDIGMVNPRFDIKKESQSKKPFIEIDFCRGYCILIKREVIEKVGLLDESYGLGYYDDDDYSVRAIRAGFRCVRANDVFVEHLRDSTFSNLFDEREIRALHEKNKRLFYSKWGRRLKIVFILAEVAESPQRFSDLLLALARRQHILYLWNLKTPLNLGHINIKERAFPRYLHGLAFSLVLFFNRWKKAPKQYDIIFFDDVRLNRMLSMVGRHAYHIDLKKDKDRITEIADSASRI